MCYRYLWNLFQSHMSNIYSHTYRRHTVLTQVWTVQREGSNTGLLISFSATCAISDDSIVILGKGSQKRKVCTLGKQSAWTNITCMMKTRHGRSENVKQSPLKYIFAEFNRILDWVKKYFNYAQFEQIWTDKTHLFSNQCGCHYLIFFGIDYQWIKVYYKPIISIRQSFWNRFRYLFVWSLISKIKADAYFG